MPYRSEPPPDKAFCGESGESPSGLSLMENTGYTGYSGYEPVFDDVLDERITAILIDSTLLGAPLWFSFIADFDPGDGVPVFYADELCLLKDKPIRTLRKIYETKRTFGKGARVRQ
jgi:hypothetical protein